MQPKYKFKSRVRLKLYISRIVGHFARRDPAEYMISTRFSRVSTKYYSSQYRLQINALLVYTRHVQLCMTEKSNREFRLFNVSIIPIRFVLEVANRVDQLNKRAC